MTSPPTRATALRLVTADATETSDDALMALAAAGRRDAFSRLVARHEGRVRTFCRAILRDAALADDVAQDVFLKLWTTRETYRADGRFRELLFTIARHACRSAERKRLVRSLFSRAESTRPERGIDLTPSAEDRITDADRDATLRAAIDRLPLKFREPLLLRFVEELPYEEIARIIGRTPSAARSRIHYGLKELALLLPPELVP